MCYIKISYKIISLSNVMYKDMNFLFNGLKYPIQKASLDTSTLHLGEGFPT